MLTGADENYRRFCRCNSRNKHSKICYINTAKIQLFWANTRFGRSRYSFSTNLPLIETKLSKQNNNCLAMLGKFLVTIIKFLTKGTGITRPDSLGYWTKIELFTYALSAPPPLACPSNFVIMTDATLTFSLKARAYKTGNQAYEEYIQTQQTIHLLWR